MVAAATKRVTKLNIMVLAFLVSLLIARSGRAGVPDKAQPPFHVSNAPGTAVFIENLGQFDSRVLYQVRIGEQTAWLTRDGIVFDMTRRLSDRGDEASLSAEMISAVPVRLPERGNIRNRQATRFQRLVFKEDFVNASCCSNVDANEQRPGTYSFFDGAPAAWRNHVRGYAEIMYHNLWPGIDLRIHGNGADLEQDFILRPGADLSTVRVAYNGIDKLSISRDGSLEIKTAFGKLRETKPRLYQQIAGKRITVHGRFALTSSTSYSFKVGAHESKYALVIDPTLLYSSFLGGSAGNNAYTSNQEVATGIAVDASGSAYVAGNTASTDFPTTTGSFQPSTPSGTFITKFTPTGSALVYSTYLGANATISAVTVDSSGQAYVTGETSAAYYGHTFPTTPNAYGQQCSSKDFFITKLNATGDGLLYSSCFGISGDAAYTAEYGYYPRAITVDSNGRAYVAGGAGNGVPTTPNAYQVTYPGSPSAHFAIFDTATSGSSSLLYATYLGALNGNGANGDAIAYGITVDSFSKVYLTGAAYRGFPVTPRAFQTVHPGPTQMCSSPNSIHPYPVSRVCCIQHILVVGLPALQVAVEAAEVQSLSTDREVHM